MTVLAPALETLSRLQPMRVIGTVGALRGLTLLVDDLPLPVGSLVSVGSARRERPPILGEIVGFTREHAIVMLLGQTTGIRVGDPVAGEEPAPTAPVGPRLLGRVIDGLGRPIDGHGPIHETTARPITPEPISALRRRRITQPMHTGVRAIDLMTTLGRGQRIGIFAGPGVGKSTLLGTIARRASSDINVIALIGERGREVGDFIAHSLGPEGLARSVVVVATSDESPLLRIRAALTACTVAEFFRDRGRDVMLMMDSITRFSHAQRQVGLSVGEPPATKGFTPSVFAAMALLLERAGALEAAAPESSGKVHTTAHERASSLSVTPSLHHSVTSPPHSVTLPGSITGLYTILVEGDDMTEPIADAARGILDGHIILSRKLAQRAHYPAVDVLDSVSRVADDVSDRAHADARRQIVRLMATYRDVEDLVQIGAYASGSNPEADVAIEYRPRILELLQQRKDEAQTFEQARSHMIKIALESGDQLHRRLRGTTGTTATNGAAGTNGAAARPGGGR